MKNFQSSMFNDQSRRDRESIEGIGNWKLKIRNFSGKAGAGYTLLETIVALAIIVGALSGPVTLVATGLVSSQYYKNKLTAINLAEEGIETIRSYRDNNILAGHPFDMD